MTCPPVRLMALMLAMALDSPAALASSSMVARFDAAVANLSQEARGAPEDATRAKRSAADFSVDRRLNIRLDFPDGVQGTMYGGLLHGEAAVFTRAGDYLDATFMRNGDTDVVSFDAPESGRLPAEVALPVAEPLALRGRRSVGPGHFEDKNAYTLHFHFLKHDDLLDRSARDLHARYVAWWLADMARILPVEPLHASYAERMPWLTSMAYGDKDSLEAFERTLKVLDDHYGFDMERTYKHKFILLTAQRPMPGTTGVAFEGGNEAIASVSGRMRIVAHEIGHMLGATHVDAETRGWWGCETNMMATSSRARSDCQEYSAANERAIRSYMRHGPNTQRPRLMVDAPAAE